MSINNTNFDPGGVGIANGNIFGFPYSVEEADVIIIPVPWDVTTSYQDGTSKAPKAILEASPQLDFVDLSNDNAWETKIALLEIPEDVQLKSEKLRQQSSNYITFLEDGGKLNQSPEFQKLLNEINKEGKNLNNWLLSICEKYHSKGKVLAVLGGDHSTPLGLMQFLASKVDYGILQIDAHADLRVAYEDFEFSHASIMHNALKIPAVKKLVQVGIRDLSPQEQETIKKDGRISCFYDQYIKESTFKGINWNDQCEKIIAELPNKVYISFDIDGLDPKLCPNTGTPVPGGFEFSEVFYLLQKVVESGRKIIGFDLCEVNPSELNDWNENVGARVLYKLAVLSNKSHYQ